MIETKRIKKPKHYLQYVIHVPNEDIHRFNKYLEGSEFDLDIFIPKQRILIESNDLLIHDRIKNKS